MTTIDRIRELIEPLIADLGIELFDLQFGGGRLEVTVDQPGGIDMQTVAEATRVISRALDDADPISGRYTLEVSSPGLERPLRTPAHFAWAVEQEVAVKTVPDYAGERRLMGTIQRADPDGIVLRNDDEDVEHRLDYDDIDSARTVFRWGAPAKSRPASGKTGRGANRSAKNSKRARAS